MSKATPWAAVAKLWQEENSHLSKDLGLMATTYNKIHMASVVMDVKNEYSIKAFLEA
ncbi:hypothetical protein P3F56_07775 [cyanobacterium endosymbiont of Epithemia clementina EcSB]|nr:hypothetical protein [cyanobacterium endosymbiont of Epithemia clementina EcSB]WGT67121.1 hypothetical protein P3F56_07775 [cyanobacterium endosymbiont of Epithemia clementina EcSB]